MSASERPLESYPDQFHQLIITKLGPIYVAFLLSLFRILVKGEVRNLPTVELFKDPLEIHTERYRKRILDSLFELLTKAEGEADYMLTALQIEHQHRNQADLAKRLLGYLYVLAQRYEEHEIGQILVYTGDEPFKSSTNVKYRDTDYKFRVVDLTHDFLTEILSYPHFGIQFLCIFNHDMPEAKKVRFIVDGFKAYYQQHGRDQAQIIMDLLALATTKHNVNALKTIIAELKMNTEFVEMIKQTPFYQMGDAEGEQRGEKRGEQKGRVNTTVEIIRNGIASLETLIQTLNLTPEEIAAIEALLQQSSNGNGNGQHI
jgi:hypothetical protein